MDEEEFFHRLSTLRADTSLGDIVQIRSASEEDLKHFNDNQKRIYYDWKHRDTNKKVEMSEEDILKRQLQLLPFFAGKV